MLSQDFTNVGYLGAVNVCIWVCVCVYMTQFVCAWNGQERKTGLCLKYQGKKTQGEMHEMELTIWMDNCIPFSSSDPVAYTQQQRREGEREEQQEEVKNKT